MAEITDYDKYNTLAAEVGGPRKPKPTSSVNAPIENKYEALRKANNQGTVVGRSTSDVTEYDKGAVAGENTTETRAYRQSATSKFMNGAIKGTGLAGTTALSTFTSLPYGILKASYQGAFDDSKTKGEAFSSVYDNEVSDFYDDFNKNMEKWMPNYYSEKEQRASAFSMDNIGSANFWADKVLKNTGFTVGAMFSGGLAAKGFQALGKLAMGAKYTQELTAMNALISTGMKPAEAMRKVASGIRAVDAATSLGASTVAAAGEGSMEAKQVKDELKDRLIEDYKAKSKSSIVPADVEANINRIASGAGNTTFAANMAILTASDYFQFGKLFSKGFKQEAARVGKMGVVDGVYSATKPTFKSKIASIASGLAKNSLTEAAEEGSQTFTQAASKDYYTRQYDAKGITSKDDLMHSMLSGLDETFGGKEGIESMLLGAITGLGSHAATSAITKVTSKAQPSEYDITSAAATVINNANKKIQPFIDSYVRGTSINEQKEANLKSKNPSRFLFGNDAHDEFKNTIQPYLETGKFDVLEDRLKDQYDREDISDWGTDSRKTAKEYVGNLISEAKRLRNSWDVIETRFPNAPKHAKLALWDAMTNVDNRENRAKDLETKIYADTGVHYSTVTKAGEDFQSLVQEAIDNERLGADINDAKDLERLVNQKKELVNRYKELLSPEEQTKVENYAQTVIKDTEAKANAVTPTNTTVEPISSPVEEPEVVEPSPITPTPTPLAPEPSNEVIEPVTPVLDQTEVVASYNNALPSIKEVLAANGKEATLQILNEQLGSEDNSDEDNEAIRLLIKAIEEDTLNDKPTVVVDPPADPVIEPEEPTVDEPVVEEGLSADAIETYNNAVDTIKDLVAKDGKANTIKFLNDQLANEDNSEDDIAAINKLIEDVKNDTIAEITNEKEPITNELGDEIENEDPPSSEGNDELDAKIEALVEADNPDILDDDTVQKDFSNEEGEMSYTGMRTTASHKEALDEGTWSIVRFQNFLSNPNTSLAGLKLMAVTPSSSLYTKLLNKKQREWNAKRAAEGKEVEGILTVVVDEKNNLVITDAGGEILRTMEPGEYEGDVDSIHDGALVSTLVSNPGVKESGHSAISYMHFGRENGFGNRVTEKEITDESTPVGAAWKAHKQEIADTRKAILEGRIKYLDITDVGKGSQTLVGLVDGILNEIGGALEVDINDPNANFIIPKISDPETPGFATIGRSEGINKEVKVKVGKPYIILNGKLYPLTTRKLNKTEIDNVVQMFNLIQENPNRKEYFLGKIKEIVYINPKQINVADILDGKIGVDDLTEYLESKYRQVDAKLLASNKEGNYEISSITKKGVNVKQTKQTYRDFIAVGENKALGTTLAPHPTTHEKDSDGKMKMYPNYLNAYLVYKPSMELVSAPKLETKEVTVADITAKPAAGRVRKPGNATPTTVVNKKRLTRLVSLVTSNKKEDIDAAKKWWASKFDGESFNVVNSLINGNAFGEYTAAATTIYSAAEEGTAYHEAFHKVTQEYLTTKQIVSLYDEVRKNVNSAFTDFEAEEYLAEQFRNFMLSGQKAIKNMPYSNNIFRKLYNYLKSLLTGKTTTQQVFDKLASNKGYTGAKKFNVQQFTKLERAIPGTTHQQTKNIVDTINGHFFETLFASGLTPDEILADNSIVSDIYNVVYNNALVDYNTILEEESTYTPEEFEAIMQHYDLLLNINEEGEPTSLNTDAKDAHINYLKGLGISLKQEKIDIEEEAEKTEEDEVDDHELNGEETGRSKAEWTNSNETSSIDSAPNSIKLLVMSLPQVDIDGNTLSNNIGGPKLNDYLNTMKLLYANLAGMSQFHEMYDKLNTISGRFPVFKELLKRLGEPGSNKSFEQFMLENDFRQAFSKFESKGTITLIDSKTGKIYQVDANANKLRDRIKENWIANLRGLSNDPNSYITRDDAGIITIKPSLFEDAASGKFKGNSKALLAAFGVEFTDLTQEDAQNTPGLRDAANTIYKYVKKAVLEDNIAINDLFSRDADVRGQMNKLLDIETPLSKEVVELSYISAEGKRIYAVSLNNYYSLTVNAINKAQTLDELFKDYPHLDNPYTKNSVWLKSIFDTKTGNKIAGQKIYMNTVSGLKLSDVVDSGIGATKMEPADKIVQEFNDLLTTGTTSLIRAADKSSEYALGITSYEKGNKLAIPLELIEDEGIANSKTHEIFFGYFIDELNRIRAFNSGVGKNIDIYNRQAMNFSLFGDILSSKTLSEVEVYKTNDDEIDALLEAKIGKDIVDYMTKYSTDIKAYMQARNVGLKTSKGISGVSSDIASNTSEFDNAVSAFALNHVINIIEQSKLLVGDSAFYKDKFKRISAGTGTKKLAASSRLVNNWFNNFYKNSQGRVDGKVSDGKVRTVIFADNKANQATFNDYVDALEKSGTSRERAEEILDAYNNMDEGDAQGWITLDEYREFYMRVGGAYWTIDHEKQYRWEVANEKSEKNQELTSREQQALDEGNPNFYFMPIKAQHFGPQVMNDIYAPAFHKYSLAPLYHSLVKGRNMETLLNSMRKNQVGYALFGSGSKVGTPVEANGKLPAFYGSNGINGIDGITPIQTISYEFLGVQLDIAPKVKEKVIFGSQFRKLLFSNLFSENTKPEFKALANEYNKLIDDLVKSEFDKLTKKLGIKVKDGKYSFNGDFRKLTSQLRDALEDKDTADNILDSLQVDENGQLVYPIDSMINRSKIESMLFSIVNAKVIKQKMSGDGQVQLASSGFESIGKRKVGSSNYLKFYEKGKDGKTTPMEVEVPMMNTFRPLLEKYKTIDALNAAIAKGEVDDKLLTLVGYRIPTQGLNSIDYMKIKRFLPESAGNAIILPTGVVAKSGGDYDIDKLNIFRPNIFYDAENDYIDTYKQAPNAKPNANTKLAMQNRILEIAKEVLSHEDNFIDLITPNTTSTLTDLVADIRKAQGQSGKIEKASATKEFRWDTIMEQFTYFLGGKAGVGIGAVHNTHHILSQIANVNLNTTIPFKSNTTKDGLVDLSKQYTQGNQKISDLISQFINAYVDVAKDPFYKDLNAGTEVAGVWFYLMRAGMDVKTIGFFMTQPIIKEYVAARKLNSALVTSSNGMKKGTYEADLSEKGRARLENIYEESVDTKQREYLRMLLDKGSVFNDVDEKYGDKDAKGNIDFKADNINDKLLGWISEGVSNKFSPEFRLAQSKMLRIFAQFEKEASSLTTLMRDTNNDTNKLQNYGSVYKRGEIAKLVKDDAVIPTGTSEKIKANTIVGSFDITDKVSNMFNELTQYTKNPLVRAALDKLIGQIPKGADFEKEYTKIQNDFIGYMTQKFGKTIEGELLHTKISLLGGENSIAKQLIGLRKQGLLDNNSFVNELVAVINADSRGIDNVKMYSRRIGAFESNVFTEDFRELLNSNNPKISEFGRNLAYATILQSGLNNSPITFTELIPHDFYGNIVKQAISNIGQLDIEDFTKAYYNKVNSNLGYRLQDFGLTEAPKIKAADIKEDAVLPKQDDGLINYADDKINSPFEGVETIKDTKLDVQTANSFIDLLLPQIMMQSYVENKAKTANAMFSYGLRWAKNIPNIGEKSIQGQNIGQPRPNRVNINSKDGRTYGYFNTDQNNNLLPSITTLKPIIDFIENKLGIDLSDYDSVLGNIYDDTSFIHQHRDTTESVTASKYPIIVINLGADGRLVYDEDTTSNYATYKTSGELKLTNGSVYAFGIDGNNRFTFHHRIHSGLDSSTPTKAITLSDGTTLDNYRITLTFRRAQDITNEPIKPSRNTNRPGDAQKAIREANKIADESDDNKQCNI